MPGRFPILVHARPCVSLRPPPLSVAALLTHVPHSSAWKTDDDRTWLSFWAHMADIPQEVSTHLGICWWVPLTDTLLLLSLLLRCTVLGLTHSSMACYMPVFQPCDPVWCPESGRFMDPCILLVLLLVKADFWSACSYCLVLPKKRAPENPTPKFPPAHSCLENHILPCPRPVCVSPSFQTMISGTNDKSTALDLRCHTTLEVGVGFIKLFRISGLIWLMRFFLAQPPPYPKFPVRSNGWKP